MVTFMLSVFLAAQEVAAENEGFVEGNLLWILLVIVLILAIVYLAQRIW